MEGTEHPFVALGSRLRGVREVLTLGVRPNFMDYTAPERELILKAQIILFPTQNYAQFFTTLGKKIFPSLETHLYADEKIKQTTLFYVLGVPHPLTRVYYHLHHAQILDDFSFPFIAKIPRRSAQGRGVFLVRDRADLESYLAENRVAYIQEYLPHDRDLRVVLINFEPIVAYWRIRSHNDFRTNLFQGGSLCFEGIPQEGIRVARESAMRSRLDDVGMDLICHDSRWYVIEANMKYGRKGLRAKGIDLREVIRRKLLSGELL